MEIYLAEGDNNPYADNPAVYDKEKKKFNADKY